MGSTRLPGKSLMNLAGAPLVARIIERCLRCTSVDEVILATTSKPEDDVLASLAESSGATAFRGSENDLVDRYYEAAVSSGADLIVRIPADNPSPEPQEVDRIVEYHRQGDFDFSSNLSQVFGNGYPDGIGGEVFSTASLGKIADECRDLHHREHVHLNYFDYSTQQPANPSFKIGTVDCPAEFRRPDLVLDVNTQEDYEFMRSLYAYLYPRNPRFHITDVISWYDDIYCGSHRKARLG